MKNLSFLVVLFLMVACGNADEAASEKKETKADTLLKEVLEAHDLVMPKMAKLERLQELATKTSDSLNVLSSGQKDISSAYKAKVDSTRSALDYAAMAMDKWMAEFRYDSLKENETERIKYLENEKEKAIKMKDAVLNALELARQTFPE